jgi:hypothetical protein
VDTVAKNRECAFLSFVAEEHLIAKLQELEENLSLLRQKGIYIVSLNEYRKIIEEIGVIGDEIERRRELTYGQTMSKKTKRFPHLTLLRGEGRSGRGAEQRRGGLSLVCK